MEINQINYYAYLRVSTEEQDMARQLDALISWQRNKKIIIPNENILTDYYTGKTFDRKNYQELKSKLKPNDYLIVKEVDRLGRDWDGIKAEWNDLKNKGINIIIIDIGILSDPLPNEKPLIEGLDLKFLREQVLTLMCYIAQKEREKISRRTKEALQAKARQGVKLGRPVKKKTYTSFVDTLNCMFENNMSIRQACYKTKCPISTFKQSLRQYKQLYQINTNEQLYQIIGGA